MKTKMSGTFIPLIVIAVLFAYIFIDLFLDNRNLKRNGKEITLTVQTCRKETSSWRGGQQWYSGGFYYVNGKKYYYRIQAIIPIGTKFKIRYAPKNPQYSELVNSHEFDKYPRKMKEK